MLNYKSNYGINFVQHNFILQCSFYFFKGFSKSLFGKTAFDLKNKDQSNIYVYLIYILVDTRNFTLRFVWTLTLSHNTDKIR